MRQGQYERYLEFAGDIASHITMEEVWNKYGVEPIKRGFVKCPFHNEKTASMKIYPDQRGFHCFGCGKSGDVISFVRELFGLSFIQAVVRIDNDFGLALPLDRQLTPREAHEANKRMKILKAEQEREQAQAEAREAAYWKVFDEWKRLDDNKRDYAPKTMDEEWNPLFVEGLQKLAYQEYLLDCAEIERGSGA